MLNSRLGTALGNKKTYCFINSNIVKWMLQNYLRQREIWHKGIH